MIGHLLASDGILIFKSVAWNVHDLPTSVLTVYCDASLTALGFWIPSMNQGFQAPALDIFQESGKSIFYLEALCVCAAVLHGVTLLPQDGRLAIFMENLNSV